MGEVLICVTQVSSSSYSPSARAETTTRNMAAPVRAAPELKLAAAVEPAAVAPAARAAVAERRLQVVRKLRASSDPVCCRGRPGTAYRPSCAHRAERSIW